MRSAPCARAFTIPSSAAGYAAAIAKAKGLKKWATCSPDYAYGRDTTGEFTLVSEALCARCRDHQRLLAETVPARLHRGRDQDPAGQAAGAVFLPVGRRSHLLYRPGQHLRDVQPDGGVRGQHGRLHRFDGGEEPAEGHSLRQPLHQDISRDAGECGLGRCLQGEVQRVSDQLVVAERDRGDAVVRGRRRRPIPPTARRSRMRCAG